MSSERTGRTPQGSTVGELAARLAAAEPSCGPVRLVAIDGHAGSGKSTLAGRLSALTGGAPVLHLDDISSHDEPFAWTERFAAQVLTPFREGRAARYGVYDWVNREATHKSELPAAPLVLLEGVGAGRRALRPYLADVVWLDLPYATAWERGLRRDGPELAEFWQVWIAEERAHFAADPTLPYARHLVRQDADVPEGFRVFPGPAHPDGTGPAPAAG